MENGVWVILEAQKYDHDLGWFCQPLLQGNAKLIDFRMNGSTFPLELIKVDSPYIRFVSTPTSGIFNAAAKIQTESGRKMDVQVKVAIIALIGVIAAAVLPAIINYIRNSTTEPAVTTSTMPDLATPTQTETKESPVAAPAPPADGPATTASSRTPAEAPASAPKHEPELIGVLKD